jgi:hypothetical protein
VRNAGWAFREVLGNRLRIGHLRLKITRHVQRGRAGAVVIFRPQGNGFRRYLRPHSRSARWSGRAGREATGSGSLDTQTVGGIRQFAPLEGQTAASDACGQIVSKSFELLNPRVELIAPTLGKTGPICFTRRALLGQRVEGITDIGERNPYGLGRPNEGQPPQCVATESPLVPLVTHGGDQTFTLIEVKC